MAITSLFLTSILTSLAAATMVTCPQTRFSFEPSGADWLTLTVSDVDMILTGLGNNTFHRSVNFQVTNSFDGSKFPCSGEQVHDNNDPDNDYFVILEGECQDNSKTLSPLTTKFVHRYDHHNVSDRFDVSFHGTFQCQNSTQLRPITVNAQVADEVNIVLNCDNDGLEHNTCKQGAPEGLKFDEFHIEPNPVLPNCAKQSLANPVWKLDQLEFRAFRDSDHNVISAPQIIMTMPFLDTFINCEAYTDGPVLGAWDKTKAQPCHSMDYRIRIPHPPTTVKFDEDTGAIRIEQTWNCTDGVKGLTTFKGVATARIPNSCTGDIKTDGCNSYQPVTLTPTVTQL